VYNVFLIWEIFAHFFSFLIADVVSFWKQLMFIVLSHKTCVSG